MTWNEIQANWRKSKSSGGVHKEFPQEMAKRTVIRRLVKMLFNTAPTLSNEASTIVASYNRTTDDEYDNQEQIKDIKGGVANVIDLEEIEGNDAPEAKPKDETKTNLKIKKPNKGVSVDDNGEVKLV